MIPIFYSCCQFFLYLIFKFWNRLEVHGAEQIPASGGCIIAANHLSFLDPPVLGGGLKRRIIFLAKEGLFKRRFLGRVIMALGARPVLGDSEFRTIRSIIRLLKSGEIVALFPEGTRSKTGQLQMHFKQGVAFLAQTVGVPVFPCYIDGTARALPRGSWFFRPVKIRVFIDRPLSSVPSELDKSDHYERLTQAVMEQIQFLERKYAV